MSVATSTLTPTAKGLLTTGVREAERNYGYADRRTHALFAVVQVIRQQERRGRIHVVQEADVAAHVAARSAFSEREVIDALAEERRASTPPPPPPPPRVLRFERGASYRHELHALLAISRGAIEARLQVPLTSRALGSGAVHTALAFEVDLRANRNGGWFSIGHRDQSAPPTKRNLRRYGIAWRTPGLSIGRARSGGFDPREGGWWDGRGVLKLGGGR